MKYYFHYDWEVNYVVASRGYPDEQYQHYNLEIEMICVNNQSSSKKASYNCSTLMMNWSKSIANL